MATKFNLNVLAFFSLITLANASETFNGIPLDQDDNFHRAHVYGADDSWYVDIRDQFDRDGLLLRSFMDTNRIGFVPPSESFSFDPNLIGQWMGSDDYLVNNGSVSRTTSDSVAIACAPWRVTSDLGDFYLIELDANVADSESVRLGYFGDVSVHDPTEGLLDGAIGQLILDITRDGDDLNWTINWAAADPADSKPFFAGSLFDVTGPINLQLGWNEDDHSFDAWLTSESDAYHLAAGGMGHNIDVFGVGFELTGTNSTVDTFLAAVPEPNSVSSIALIGLLSILKVARRRKQ